MPKLVATKTVDEYLSVLPFDQKQYLEKLRALIKSKVPDAVESISYGLPAYKFKKKPLIYYGAFKTHLSLFAAGKAIIKLLAEELKDYKTSDGTIQFSTDKPLPDSLITKIIDLKLKEINELILK